MQTVYNCRAVEWYEHITAANEELRELFDQMALSRATPEEFGIRVKSHPDLLVTGAVKMRNGHELQLTYSGDITETIGFYRDSAHVNQNYEDTDKFIRCLGVPANSPNPGDKVIWAGVSGDKIVNEFLANIKVHPTRIKRGQNYFRSIFSSAYLKVNWWTGLSYWFPRELPS